MMLNLVSKAYQTQEQMTYGYCQAEEAKML